MAATNENLLQHLKSSLSRLEKSKPRAIYTINNEVFDMLNKISALLLELTTSGSQ